MSNPFPTGDFPMAVLALERADGLAESIKGGGLPIVGSRALGPIPFSVPNSLLSYASGTVLGGVLTIPTGLPGGTIIYNGIARIKMLQASATVTNVIVGFPFNASPVSAFTDGAVLNSATHVTADLAKGYNGVNGSWSGVNNMSFIMSFAIPRMPVDANGNIYVVPVAAGTNTFTATGVLQGEFDCLY